jgi:hypothetical protein
VLAPCGSRTETIAEVIYDTPPNAVWNGWTAQLFARRSCSRLTGSDRLRPFGITVCGHQIEDGIRPAAGINVLSCRNQTDAVIAEDRQDFEQIGHGFAWQVTGRHDHDLIDLSQLTKNGSPTGVLPTTDDGWIVANDANDSITTALDGMAKKLDLPPALGGSLSGIDDDSHDQKEPRKFNLSIRSRQFFCLYMIVGWLPCPGTD